MLVQVEDSISWLLNYASRLAMRRATAKLQAYGITPPQWAVLAQLTEENGQSLSSLGTRALFDGPTMTGIVDRLESGGYVERRRDSSDRRVINLYLTEKGRQLVSELPPIDRLTDEDVVRGLSQTEVECFRSTLQRIISRQSEDSTAA